MREIIITGANGYLGRHLISKIISMTDFKIIALARKKEDLLKKNYDKDRVTIMGNDEFLGSNFMLSEDSILIHLAFARRFRPNSEIADSLDFSKKVFNFAKKTGIGAVLNISTQSVYGNAIELRTENTVVSPEMIYAMAKYANEVLLESILEDVDTRFSNIRLDSIASNQVLLPTLVKNSIESKTMNIVGGKQIFSFLDVDDVAIALCELLKTPIGQWRKVYNLGSKEIYTLTELSEIVKNRIEHRLGISVTVNYKSSDIVTYAGVDSKVFESDTGWKPLCSIYDIVDHIIDEYLHGGAKSESH